MAERNYRGSKIVPVRIDDATLLRVEAIVAKSVLHSKLEPYTVSSWIKTLIQRELNSLERRRRKAKKGGHDKDDDIEVPNGDEVYATDEAAA